MNLLRPDRREKLYQALVTRVRQRGATAMAIRLSSATYCWTVAVDCEPDLSRPEPAPLFLAYSLTKA